MLLTFMKLWYWSTITYANSYHLSSDLHPDPTECHHGRCHGKFHRILQLLQPIPEKRFLLHEQHVRLRPRFETMPMMSIERILLIDEVDEDNTVVVMSIFPDFKKFAGPTWKDEIWSTNCLLIKYQRESPQGHATQVCSHRKVSMLLHSVIMNNFWIKCF